MGIVMIAGTERRRQGCSLQDGKQWGKILGDTVNLKIINFPVSFNECFGGLALFNGDPVAAAEYATITDITNTNFKIYMYANNAGTGYTNANIFYLFLGAQQQWGIVYAEQGYIIVTLPLAYSSNKYVVIGQDLDYTSNDTDGYGENVGVTQVTTTSIRVSITRGRYLSYCTIGF